jgi:hypothetical protein
MRLFAGLIALLCAGCMPIAQHGPWVRPGLSGSVGGSAAVAGDVGSDESSLSPFFSFDGGMRLGMPFNDTTHHGVSVGLHLPLLGVLAGAFDEQSDDFGVSQLLNVDAYVAAPAGGATSLGVGMTASRYHTMPYIQVGRLDQWYGTLGIMNLNETYTFIIAPSFTQVRRNTEQRVSHITLTAGLGSGESEIAILAGISLIFEFHGKNARP